MASQKSQTGPIPTSSGASPGGGVPLPPTPAQLQAAFEHGIWYILSLWPALHTAVQNSWGGPSSADKRDWFAGATADLITTNPNTDHDDLVVFLLQVMQDEFDLMVEDDSEEEIAGSILGLKRRLGEERDSAVLRELEQRWKGRGQMKVEFRGEIEEEGEWEGIEDDDEDGVDEMEGIDEAPELVPAVRKERVDPEVDDEGFTKVTKKKR
ncbi:rRNA accumulation- protein [Saxophila tyrrhenica]|uniref:rRNA accumulation- protein n=1 Tax=Saxophila tyrrhenica TaxID=1690608 RepID=A0AAV9PB35_9PEZI|nr:rRNA accumulation- protein [Saxophila tyrrhenica]